jgi:DNA-binding PadR family transcriptional regulator
MPAAKAGGGSGLTTPDLVLLSLLAERPMHGYQANLELERREVRDWAAISKPQIYYSLEKLARLGFVHEAQSDDAAAGPERQVYATTARGRAALADALERDAWTTQRERPPFLTWMALSWQARPGVFTRQLRRRAAFLRKELAREQDTLKSILQEVGHEFHEAVWMVTLTIAQFRTELLWLRRLQQTHRRRAIRNTPARRKTKTARIRFTPRALPQVCFLCSTGRWNTRCRRSKSRRAQSSRARTTAIRLVG